MLGVVAPVRLREHPSVHQPGSRARVVPGIDPGSFVLLGLHTSDMSKDEMSNLIELIHAFGAEHDVVFHDQQQEVAA